MMMMMMMMMVMGVWKPGYSPTHHQEDNGGS